MYGHGLAVILTTVPREDYSMRCGMACQANKHMTLETTDHCRVRDHLREDHLSPARRTTHRPHAYGTIHPSPEYKHWPPGGAVIGYAVDMFVNHVPLRWVRLGQSPEPFVARAQQLVAKKSNEPAVPPALNSGCDAREKMFGK